MRHLILISILLILVSGCSTTQTRSTGLAPTKDISVTYKRSVSSITAGDVATGYCANDVARLKQVWDWKIAVEAGNLCVKSKDFKRVEEVGNLLSVKEPSAPWGPFFLAQAARNRQEFERALWMSDLALKRAVNVGLLHYLKAQILHDTGDAAGSVASFEKSTELDNTLWSAHLYLGQIYFRDQDYSLAAKHFQEVVKRDRFHLVALTGLAESYLQLKNPRAAVDAYGRLASRYTSDGQFLRRLGEIHEKSFNDPAQALGYYRKLNDLQTKGRIKQNADPEVRSKIKALAGTVEPTRSVAGSPSEQKGNKK